MSNITRYRKLLLAALPLAAFATFLSACGDEKTPVEPQDAPKITYYVNQDEAGPGFMWAHVNTALTAKEPTSFGGPVTTYSISPELPAGVSIDAATGAISGTPTDTSASREYTVIATGPGGSDTAVVMLASLPTSMPLRLLEMGETRYESVCSHCHAPDGKGAIGPPVHPSDYLMADKDRAVRIQILGLPNNLVDTASVITVNGVEYQGSMFAPQGNDSTIAAVLTFVRTMFNGASEPLTPAEVGVVRDTLIALDTAQEYGIEDH